GGDHTVHFAGSDRGLEARVLPALGLPFTAVRAAGLVGTGLGGALKAVWSLALGGVDALGLLRRFRPQVCLGVGGYVSFPVVALARLLGVPVAVQEQNAFPGLSNRVLARLARRVYVGDPTAVARLPAGKTRVTGNPLRRRLREPLPYRAPALGESPHLLVVGGSQGAASLNRALPAALESLGRPVLVRHQAGRGRAAEVADRYAGREGVQVEEFIDDMQAAYRWAHLVVSRAGALSVAELEAAGRPAVLVPYPFAAGNHQEANARAAAERRGAVCLLDADLERGALAAVLEELLAAPERLAEMATAAAAAARRDAARDIVDDLLNLGGEG
ncbi:MAG TPA: UDP-N-acetylglucosamine--N-acetylmuramyl-(pentapeptide) pyrophosphoryl-undecaprenol N-acetylglucosamine transferase, partial [Deferrisomatales bacterium]|nr:UDP-N-acetylglucosamine--N-acetylmuramyl-(pentapeptide) pyrophosphoryl-undecaprenol N-acetylglucosamine transferase [Deferrisomatales bacterium]